MMPDPFAEFVDRLTVGDILLWVSGCVVLWLLLKARAQQSDAYWERVDDRIRAGIRRNY